jgi:hypothetical protein
MVAAYRGKLCFANKLRTLTDHAKAEIIKRDEFTCRYCGEVADCVDHIIPHSWAPDNHPDNLAAACTPCNLMAGNKMFKNFDEKRYHILDLLSKACMRGRIKVWTKEEVLDLGHTLRSKIVMSCVVVETEGERQRVTQLLEERKYRVRADLQALLRAQLV